MSRPDPRGPGGRNRLYASVGRFVRNRVGASAMEFALIAPVLILVYFGLGELGQGLMAQRRVSHVASTIGDLSAQVSILHDSDLADIAAVGNTMMWPMATTPLAMRITSITENASSQVLVDWSYAQGVTPYANSAPITVPTGLISNPGDSVIMSEATYAYTSPVSVVLPNGINFSEKYYFRPRKSVQVTRVSP